MTSQTPPDALLGPDDFDAIEKLMHIDRKTLLARLSIPDDLVQKYLTPPSEPSSG